jgi:hypothetical protein
MLRLLNRRFTNRVYMIDEFKTSSLCPDCSQPVENFLVIPNPRLNPALHTIDRPNAAVQANNPVLRQPNRPDAGEPWTEGYCWGLKRCTNCILEDGGVRLWNRDLMATLNFQAIFVALANGEPIPERFRRV